MEPEILGRFFADFAARAGKIGAICRFYAV
jgi:hypothetical protein